ncbi:MAG: DUF493 family protein [Amphritea sp.]
MSETEAPKIEFPCADYPIKVIGRNAPDFKEFVIDTMKKYDPTLDVAKVTEQGSRNGKFLSVRLMITATGADQLEELHKEFISSGRVQMVM